MKKIIIAVDFSESCTNAITYINELVRGKQITIDLVNVYSLPISTLTSITPKVADSVIEECKLNSKKILEELMNLIAVNNRGSIHAVYGISASTDVIDKAVSTNADLIVMALRQKYSIIDRFMGTVTAATISKSPIPVLAIPNGATHSTNCNVLFPTEEKYKSNISDSFRNQIERLLEFCTLFSSSNIYSIHVEEGSGIDIRFKFKKYENLRFISSNATSIDEGIKKTIDNYPIHLIAIHKKSRSFWERLYHSSITRKLLFQSRLPILVFTD